MAGETPRGVIADQRAINAASAVISDNTLGNNTIVAAPGAGLKIVVWNYVLVVEGAVDVRWESAAGGTALSGQMAFTAAGEGVSASSSFIPLFECAENELLNMELSGAVLVQGHLGYTIEVI